MISIVVSFLVLEAETRKESQISIVQNRFRHKSMEEDFSSFLSFLQAVGSTVEGGCSSVDGLLPPLPANQERYTVRAMPPSSTRMMTARITLLAIARLPILVIIFEACLS